MAAIRRADATWEGDLRSGHGRVSAVTSGTFSDLAITWASRTELADGRTSPEELLAAAHASCYSMALSNGLAKAGTPATRLETSVSVAFEPKPEGGWKVASSTIQVRGWVPGTDADSFRAAAEAAKDGCPISGALKGNVALAVEATLEA